MKKNENNVTCDTDVNVLSVRYYLMLKIPDEVKVDYEKNLRQGTVNMLIR